MRILVFTTNYLPNQGGAELAIFHIARELKDLSWTLITSRLDSKLPKYERIGNVEVYRVGWGSFFDKFLISILGYRLALKLEKKQSFDVIWSMMASQASVAAARFKMKFGAKKRLVLSLQEGDDEKHLYRYVGGSRLLFEILIKPFQAMVFENADAITVLSQSLAERSILFRKNLVPIVVPNGVSDIFFQENKSSDNEEKIILSVSRLVEKNGLEFLVRAIPLVKSNVVLKIVGGGNLRENLERVASSLALGSKVVFLGDLPHDTLPDNYRMANVFVRPSLSEGFGNVFLEAMASNVPVVGTPVGGIVDIVSDGYNGVLVPSRDPRAIAEAIDSILLDEKFAEKLRSNGRVTADKYRWSDIAKKMSMAFTDAIS